MSWSQDSGDLWVSLGVLQCGSAAIGGPLPPPPQEGSRPQAGGYSRQTCADGHLMKRTVFTMKTSGERLEWHAHVCGVSLDLGTSYSCLVGVLPHWFSSSDFGFVQPASHLSTGLWRHKEVLGTESLWCG